MLERRLNVAVIIGSTRTGRFGPVPAKWVAAEAAKRDDFDVDVIDLARCGCPTCCRRASMVRCRRP